MFDVAKYLSELGGATDQVARAVEAEGGEIVLVDILPGHSTTRLVERR